MNKKCLNYGGNINTSLLGLGWTHFLTHHLSPYLYIIGYTARIFGNTVAALLAWHAIGITATLYGIYRILQFYSWGKTEILFAICAIILLPAPRIALLWEVHDEIFATPLLVWALYFFIRRLPRRMYVVLLGACAIKETMSLVVSVFAVMNIVREVSERKAFRLERRRYFDIAAFVIGIGSFLLYTRILPGWLFWSSFNGFTRIGTFEQLVAFPIVRAKLWWLTTLLLPLIPVLFFLVMLPNPKRRIGNFLLYALPASLLRSRFA